MMTDLEWDRLKIVDQNAMIDVRDATLDDAEASCIVVRRSIAELCKLDHKDDPAILSQWLRNTTAENFARLLDRDDTSLLVAVENDFIVAVGLFTNVGSIHLNYVSPEFRFRGISRGLLHALEQRALDRGSALCNLMSTEKALRFYLANGYKQSGAATGAFGTTSGYPMTKPLV